MNATQQISYEPLYSSITTATTTTTPHRNKNKNIEDICGNFMGYYITPSGRVISKSKNKFLEPTIRNGIPYIHLCENGVMFTYRLDEVVYRSFHCTYVMGSKRIIHIDGDQGNCRLKNLSI
jgi:hypothetical protein